MILRSIRILTLCLVTGGMSLAVLPASLLAQEDTATESAAETAAEETVAETATEESSADAAEATDTTQETTEETSESTESPEAATTDDSAEKTDDAASETTTETTEAAAESTAAKPGPAAAAFEKVFNDWKALLTSIRAIKAEYLVAEKDKLDGLQMQFKDKIAEGKKMEPKLREAAINAYKESPNSDREIVKFLITIAADQIRMDDYASATKLTQILLDGKSQEKQLSDLVGIAAFGSNDFDRAEKYLKAASTEGTISQQGSQFLAQVDVCKETWAKEAQLREAEAKANDLPRVKLTTDQGPVTVELFENEAPETVGNFISLVEKGYYDGLVFHRVMEAFMAQGGCPDGNGGGGPGYNIYCECVNDNHRNHFAGSLSMAKQQPRNTGGSQFFLTFVPTTHLNGQHTVFGRVIEGMDVLPKIIKRTPDSAPPTPDPTVILKAEVVRKRDHEYRPNKVK